MWGEVGPGVGGGVGPGVGIPVGAGVGPSVVDGIENVRLLLAWQTTLPGMEPFKKAVAV
jgi:hypothetical protein